MSRPAIGVAPDFDKNIFIDGKEFEDIIQNEIGIFRNSGTISFKKKLVDFLALSNSAPLQGTQTREKKPVLVVF